MDTIFLMLAPIIGGVIFFLFIMAYLFGNPIRMYKLFGEKIERIPHHNKEIQQLRIDEMKRILAETKESHPKDYKDFLPRILSVCGELKDLSWISECLMMEFKIDLIIGNKIWSSIRKKELISLMNTYPDQISVYSRTSRPDWHTQKLGDTIVIEDLHSVRGSYPFATVIRHTKDELLSDFDFQFEKFKPSQEATIEQIEKLGTYN